MDKKPAKRTITIAILKTLGCIAVALIATTVIAGVLLSRYFDLSDNSPPDIDVQKEVASPDGKNVATFYILSGGGAAGYITMRVKVRPGQQKFKSDEEYVFEMAHKYNLKLRWKSNRHLEVIYPSQADVYQKSPVEGNVQITYTADSTLNQER